MEIIFALGIFFSGGWLGYDYGKDVQAEECRQGIYQLQTVIADQNKQRVDDQTKLQLNYEEALRIQSITAANIQKDYRVAVDKIERIKNEEPSNCAFQPVDYDIINRLRE